MAVIIYNDYLRSLLKDLDCILTLDTAADYLGLTNGGYREIANILVKRVTGLDGVREKVVDDYSNFEYTNLNGLNCTTINQTIVDLINNDSDEQIITESLANYYDTHDESFEGLEIPVYLQYEDIGTEIFQKEYQVIEKPLCKFRKLAIELRLPKHGSNYAILGLAYEHKEVGVNIEIAVATTEGVEFKESLAMQSDNANEGIPEFYVQGIEKSIDDLPQRGILHNGIYKFFIGAYAEVGSSEMVFRQTSNILLRLLGVELLAKEVIKEIVKNELA